jgi:hypothetical protein
MIMPFLMHRWMMQISSQAFGKDCEDMIANIPLRIHWCSVITLALVSFASGCVILPIPIPSETHLEFMDRKDGSFIEAGKSSRDDVLDNLGSPTVLSSEPSIWIYSIKEYQSTGWQVCGAAIGPSGGGAGCPTEFEGREKYSFLEIQFDSSGIVTHRQVSSLAIGECTEAGFCWDGLPAFLATRGVRVPPAWHCAVHLYTTNAAISANLEIMGPEEFDLSLTNKDFQLVLLQSWEPDIVISFDDGSKKRLPVPCDKESAHFMQIDRGASAYNMRWVPEYEGRRVVINKQTLTRVNF